MKQTSPHKVPRILAVCIVALGLLAPGFNSARAQQTVFAFPARTNTAGTSLLAPFYWIPSAGAGFAVSSGTTSVAGAPNPNYSFYHGIASSAMTVGQGYGIACAGDTAVGDGKNVVYLVEAAFPSSNCSTDLIVGLSSANCAIGGVAHGTIAACAALQNAYVANLWSSVCYLTNNVGATHPDIGFKYVSGANNRFYATVIRFTQQHPPCANAGPCAIRGPVSTNDAFVTVTGVTNASDVLVAVYEQTNGVENPYPIGYLASGIVAGDNQVPVTWDANSLGATVIACQTTPAGQEGCHNYAGAYVVGGGANPTVRVSLNCRTSKNNLNFGPVGKASDATANATSLFFMPGATNASQFPQLTGILLTPSTNWQTVVIDPRTVQKGWVWSGFDSGGALAAQDNVRTWAGLEGLIFQQDPSGDTGPLNVLIDNIYSGPDLLVNFETDWAGGTYNTSTGAVNQVFYSPTNSYEGYPVGYTEGPNSALVLSNNFAVSGTNVEQVKWQWSSAGENWFRFLMWNGTNWNYPQIHMDAPFQFDILLLPKGATQAYAVATAPPLADVTNCPSTAFGIAVNVTPPYDTTTGQPLTRNYTYQWSKNGTPIGTATQSSYTIASVASSDSGTYSVAVGDGSGNTLARHMILTVPTAVQIDSQPLDQGPILGDGNAVASFGISGSIPGSCPCANDTAVGYRWMHNGVPLSDGGNIFGATSSSLLIQPAHYADAGTYTCVVTNTCTLQTVTSTNAMLWVQPNQQVMASCGQQGLLDLDWTNKAASYPPNPAFTGLPAATNAVNDHGFPAAPVSYDWGTISFAPVTFPDASNYFTLRFLGTFQPPFDPGSGQVYTFYVRSDDGARLWVNGQLVIDSWINQSATTRSGSILLTTNSPVELILEYFENTGSASVQLSYSSLSQPTTEIPGSQLCPATPGQQGGGGIAPTAELASPANNATSVLPAPVALTANVTPWDATINSVQFYNNGTALLATVSEPGPYTQSWTPPAAGVYNISARVNYNGASMLNTESNKLTVLAPLASSVTISNIVNNGDGTLSINYGGGAGSQFILVNSGIVPNPTRDSWTAVKTNTATPGSFTITPAANAFYSIQSK